MQKVEDKAFVTRYIDWPRECKCNVHLKSGNVLSANGEDLVNILVNLEETQINIAHINKISNDINNAKLGEFSTPTSITTDKPSINNATLTDQGRINGVLGGFWRKD